MNLHDLTFDERLALGARAEHACASRLRRIAEWVDPSDGPLRRLIRNLAEEWQPWLDTLTVHDFRVRREPVADARVALVVEKALHPLRVGLGERPMDRDAALFFAEQVEATAQELYRRCSGLPEDQAGLFRQAADRRKARLERLKSVLLPITCHAAPHED